MNMRSHILNLLTFDDNKVSYVDLSSLTNIQLKNDISAYITHFPGCKMNNNIIIHPKFEMEILKTKVNMLVHKEYVIHDKLHLIGDYEMHDGNVKISINKNTNYGALLEFIM